MLGIVSHKTRMQVFYNPNSKNQSFRPSGKENFQGCISLFDVILELNLRTTSVPKTDVNNMFWATVEKFLRELFYNFPTQIIVCDMCVTIPETFNRNEIIAKNHTSVRKS